MEFHLHKIVEPFTPPPILQAHLKKYLSEYGAGERAHLPFPDSFTVWTIENENAEVCGFAWWGPPREDPRARDISLAVFDDHASQHAGSFAMRFLEDEARRAGITALCAQVNTTEDETGLKVRKWLVKLGFAFAKESILHHAEFTTRTGESTDAFLARWARPVFFRKDMQRSDGGATRTP